MHDVAAPPSRAVRPSRAARSAAWLTLGFLLLQAAWILTVPPFRGSDEFDHAYRAAAVAGGDWVATEPARDGRGLLLEVPETLVRAATAQCSELDYTGPDNCESVGAVGDGRVLIASGAAAYFPAYYAVVGTVGELATGAQSLYLMRVATALVCAAFVLAAAWSSGLGASRWPLRALVLAVSPVFAYSTSIVAPNGLEMAAGLALWCSLVALGSGRHRSEERVLVVIAVVSATVMCLLRLLGPAFVLAAVVTVWLFRRGELWAAARRHTRLVLGGSVAVASAAALFLWWVTGPGAVRSLSGPDGGEDLKPIYAVLWPLQSIAAFPYRDQPGPLLVYGVVGALVVALVLLALKVATSWSRLVVLAAAAGALVLPFAATLATSEGRGVIWQGRYGLAFAVGFILLAGWVLGESVRPPEPPWPFAAVLMTAYGAALGACYLKVRRDELADNPASVADGAWLEPAPATLVVLTLLAMLALANATFPREPRRG